MNLTTISVFGVEYLVDYSFSKGYPATLEEPGYDDEFEINSISIEPSEENQAEYVVFLSEYCRKSDEWLESDELHDMIQSELCDTRIEYLYSKADYDDNFDDIYFD